jgi:hypothetical protein
MREWLMKFWTTSENGSIESTDSLRSCAWYA